MNFKGQEASDMLKGIQEAKNKGADAVRAFIFTIEEAKDMNNWMLLGGKKSNHGIVNAQAPSSQKCSDEKSTNMMDAYNKYLVESAKREAKKTGETYVEPLSLPALVKQHTGMDIERPDTIDKKKFLQFANNFQVIASGTKDDINLGHYDRGIGLLPEVFPSTILSLNDGNKQGVPWNIGQYNMGGSGAPRFAKHGLQLIASSSRLDNETRRVGFTVVMRFVENGVSVYRYFAPNAEVPEFELAEGEGINLGLDSELFTEGTFVELYSYRLGKKYLADITANYRKELQQSLFGIPYPIKIVDHRINKSKPRIDVAVPSYFKFAWNADLCDATNSFEIVMKPFGSFKVTYYVIGKDMDRSEFISGNSVIITSKGQAQKLYPKTYITNEVGMKYLSGDLMIHIDATDIESKDLFFNSDRASLAETDEVDEFQKILVDKLRHTEELVELNKERFENQQKHMRTDDVLIDNIKDLFPSMKDLIKNLSEAGIGNFVPAENTAEKKEKGSSKAVKKNKTKKTAAVVKLTTNEKAKATRALPLGDTGIIRLQPTDSFSLNQDAKVEFVVVQHRESGSGSTTSTKSNKPTVKPLEDFMNLAIQTNESEVQVHFTAKSGTLSIGDELVVNATISQDGHDYKAVINVNVKDPNSVDLRKIKSAYGFPEKVKIKKDNPLYEQYGWDESDVVKVVTDPNFLEKEVVSHICINMNNKMIQNFLLSKKRKGESNLLLEEQYANNIYTWAFSYYANFVKNHDEDSELSASDKLNDMFKQNPLMYINFDQQGLLRA